MVVQLLTNLGSNDFPGYPFKDGETHEVTDLFGAKLVRLKLAVDVTPAPKAAEPKEATGPEEEAPKADKFAEVRKSHKPASSK